MTLSIAENLENLRIKLSEVNSGLSLSATKATLIAVSKKQPEEKILKALASGQRHFGENYMQEAQQHWKAKRDHYPDLQIHFIGALQSNKASDAVALCDVIHTVDRTSLAKSLHKAMDKQDKRPDCLIQINTGREPQKAGVLPEEADKFIARCVKDYQLPIRGLMCIPPEGMNVVPHFAFLRKLAHDNGLAQLSMGMSSDWELAARMGATHIRVGTAIFGSRDYQL